MKEIRHLIIDMDGVLWHGDRPMPGLADLFATLHELGIEFVLATNNAMKTPQQYIEKLARFGVAVEKKHIFTSALATAVYLKGVYPDGADVYVVGGDGLRQALGEQGFNLLNPPAGDGDEGNGRSPIITRADVVAVGLFTGVTYRHLAEATACIRNGARFVGSNPDLTVPSEWGQLPGAGSLLALLQTSTGVAPTVVGKPGPIMFREALRRLNGTPADTAMVGDRLETDIEGGHAAGLRTILVLSGISQRTDLDRSVVQPDFALADIMALAHALRAETAVQDP